MIEKFSLHAIRLTVSSLRTSRQAFSLVEVIIGLGVMALVITGGLVALGQATLISEKNSAQTMADFLLRGEIEAIRKLGWDEVSAHHSAVEEFLGRNPANEYPNFLSLNENALLDLGFEAKVMSARLSESDEIGKIAYKLQLEWTDRSGKTHDETRVLIITEGGFSADA